MKAFLGLSMMALTSLIADASFEAYDVEFEQISDCGCRGCKCKPKKHCGCKAKPTPRRGCTNESCPDNQGKHDEGDERDDNSKHRRRRYYSSPNQ